VFRCDKHHLPCGGGCLFVLAFLITVQVCFLCCCELYGVVSTTIAVSVVVVVGGSSGGGSYLVTFLISVSLIVF
jgi:hypothetical protein